MDLRLVEYEQRCTLIEAAATYEAVPANNLPPLLLRTPQAVPTLRQAGRAVVWGPTRFLYAPPPIVDPAVHLAQPKVEYHRVPGRPYLRETVWEYVLAVTQEWIDEVYSPFAAEAWPLTPDIRVG